MPVSREEAVIARAHHAEIDQDAEDAANDRIAAFLAARYGTPEN